MSSNEVKNEFSSLSHIPRCNTHPCGYYMWVTEAWSTCQDLGDQSDHIDTVSVQDEVINAVDNTMNAIIRSTKMLEEDKGEVGSGDGAHDRGGEKAKGEQGSGRDEEQKREKRRGREEKRGERKRRRRREEGEEQVRTSAKI